MITIIMRVFIFLCCFLFSLQVYAEPATFQQAKKILKEQVYFDRASSDFGTLYCGCNWDWVGQSGGRTDLERCGYQTRAQPNRAKRIEYEHIVPAHSLGQQRQCWQQGGRKNCVRTDPVFNRMHVDLRNLSISVGEYNADRSNFRFSMLPDTPFQHGACPSKVDFKQRAAEPRDKSKGLVARTYFYMHDRYNLPMSRSQQQLMMAWDKQYPPSPWELERERRLTRAMRHANPFLSGEKSWVLGHKNSGAGLKGFEARAVQPLTRQSLQDNDGIRGNKNSRVYHLPTGCPSYNAMALHNRVFFSSESEAVSAGYRKAGNCRK